MADALDRLRRICLAFPEVTERPSHGAPTWFVRDKKAFVTFWRRASRPRIPAPVVCRAAGRPGGAAAAAPDRVFRPPYVGHRGWLGVRLDGDVDWAEIAEWCEDAYRVVAPKTLVAGFDRHRAG